ncbi:MAG: phosphohydrolase [Clostridia bacterium]|nr:phosphohydrolase [Clostridia bacterium]
MLKEKLTEKMIVFYKGNIRDINHFIKVHAFASLIGKMEGIDAETLNTLEIAAIVHDIACPLCREKYGNTNGARQEEESEALLVEFLREFHLSPEVEKRVIFLVTHHHTYDAVNGIDYQILLEADFLVNAGESEKYATAIGQFRKNVFKTATGHRLLKEIHDGT